MVIETNRGIQKSSIGRYDVNHVVANVRHRRHDQRLVVVFRRSGCRQPSADRRRRRVAAAAVGAVSASHHNVRFERRPTAPAEPIDESRLLLLLLLETGGERSAAVGRPDLTAGGRSETTRRARCCDGRCYGRRIGGRGRRWQPLADEVGGGGSSRVVTTSRRRRRRPTSGCRTTIFVVDVVARRTHDR